MLSFDWNTEHKVYGMKVLVVVTADSYLERVRRELFRRCYDG